MMKASMLESPRSHDIDAENVSVVVAISDRLNELKDAGSNGTQAAWKRHEAESGVRYEADGSAVVTTGPIPEIGDDEYQTFAESIAGQIPDGFRVRLAEAKIDPAAWHRDNDGEQAVTRRIVRYRFIIEPAPNNVSVDDLLESIGRRRTTKSPEVLPGAGVLAVAAGDLQIGKPDGDGTEGTIRRFLESHDESVKRYKQLRKQGKVDEVLLMWAGDCIEGTVSQGGNLISRLDVTLTEAVRIYRRLMLEQVKAFAGIASKVTIAVVPGNHDEAVRVGNQMASRYDDSWAIEGASQVADAMKLAGYENLEWVFPGIDELDLCIEVAGTTIGLLHGHQTRAKMEAWLGAAAVQRRAIGTADLVISGHFHHLKIQQLGPTTHIQVPALDGGSVWWRHKGGLDAPPGMVTLIVNNGWRSLEIL
jgi:predicted phosphodiesterase